MGAAYLEGAEDLRKLVAIFGRASDGVIDASLNQGFKMLGSGSRS